MNRQVWIIISLLLLAFASYGAYYLWQKHQKASEDNSLVLSWRQDVRTVLTDEVASKLTDPGSAQFRDLVLYHSLPVSPSHTIADQLTGAYTLCGEVNSKNQFGGYTGYTPFVVNVYSLGDIRTEEKTVFLPHEGAENLFMHIWRERCIGEDRFPKSDTANAPSR